MNINNNNVLDFKSFSQILRQRIESIKKMDRQNVTFKTFEIMYFSICLTIKICKGVAPYKRG